MEHFEALFLSLTVSIAILSSFICVSRMKTSIQFWNDSKSEYMTEMLLRANYSFNIDPANHHHFLFMPIRLWDIVIAIKMFYVFCFETQNSTFFIALFTTFKLVT